MKLNIHLIIAILWSAVFLLSACSDDPENGQPEVPVLTFDKDQQLVFETAGGQADVHFTSTAAWTAEVDQDWCSVTPARGDATSSVVTLTVTANETPDERNATLILKSGTTTARMTFVQKQKDALTVTSNRVEVGAEGGEVAVEVKANIAFDCEVDETAAEWLSAVQTRSMTSTQLRFTAAANESFDKREGKIVIRSGELSETVTVYQAGEQPGVMLTQDEYTVGSEGGIVAVELRSNVPFQMRMLDDVAWLSEAVTRSFSTYTRRFEVAPNEDYDYRSARVAFFNEELGLADTVTITQVQKMPSWWRRKNIRSTPWEARSISRSIRMSISRFRFLPNGSVRLLPPVDLRKCLCASSSIPIPAWSRAKPSFRLRRVSCPSPSRSSSPDVRTRVGCALSTPTGRSASRPSLVPISTMDTSRGATDRKRSIRKKPFIPIRPRVPTPCLSSCWERKKFLCPIWSE